MRQIFLDTETTGFSPENGDRIIEIGAVEMVKRRLTQHNYHQYINPEREIPEDAIRVHGITDERVKDEPKFAQIGDAFMNYVKGAELIIHNAPFDVGFINHELSLLPNNPWGKIEDHCVITDSLKMAQKEYPGQRNTLDALCRRLFIDNTKRTFHGALLDSELLAEVYLGMTGGQTGLDLEVQLSESNEFNTASLTSKRQERAFKVISASAEEENLHQKKLTEMNKKSGLNLGW